MPAQPATAVARADGDIDLGAVGRALWAKRLWILLPTVIVALITFVAVEIITPRYRSEARVLFESRENVFLRPEAEKNGDGGAGDPDAAANEVQVAMSREVALDVIRQLKLAERPEFDPMLRGVSPLRSVLSAFGLARDPFKLSPEERALEAYYDRLTVYAVDRSRVIVIEFQASDPDLAARVANTIAADYIDRQRAAKQDQSRGASQWLVGEIKKLRGKVAEAEGRVADFRNKSGLLIGTNNTTLTGQQLGDVNAQLSAARAQQADAQSRANTIRDLLKRGGTIEASDVLNSDIIRRLTEQRAALRAQLAEQSTTLLDEHPRIRELRAQIANLDGQIRAEAEKLVRAFENDAKIAGARVDALNANLDAAKRQASSGDVQDVQLRALEREAKAQRDLLESYLAKYREATARETIGTAPTADARIISRAIASNTPYFPKKIPTVLVATLATLMLSCGFIATGEIMRASAGTSAVPVRRPQRAAAATPQPETVAPAAPGVPVTAISDIARRLIETAHLGRRVAVFSAEAGDGSSLAALTLARALSRESRVVLVDLAPGNPHLASISSDPHAPGLADMIRGGATFSDIITRDRLSRLNLVSLGGTGDVTAILALPEFAAAVEALARSYDYFVIDAGSAPQPLIARIAAIAPRAVLVAPAGSDRGLGTAYQHFVSAGFTDVSVATASAPPPPSAPTPVQAAAA